ncbi:hypothetical protein [Burkholderia cepacia]|uniref:hypothetical protein n=1 Tax=Burkholderia cepacia TaxID=292 RepID=UPI0012D33C28|nr:hypothetical protein [Burkholderia cepacia]
MPSEIGAAAVETGTSAVAVFEVSPAPDQSRFAEVVSFEQEAEVRSNLGAGSGSEYVRVVEVMDALGTIKSEQLMQIYRNSASFGGCTVQVEIQLSRKPSARYGKQRISTLAGVVGKMAAT